MQGRGAIPRPLFETRCSIMPFPFTNAICYGFGSDNSLAGDGQDRWRPDDGETRFAENGDQSHATEACFVSAVKPLLFIAYFVAIGMHLASARPDGARLRSA
jgi:hypothetical protein